jgi:hypothetical protein
MELIQVSDTGEAASPSGPETQANHEAGGDRRRKGSRGDEEGRQGMRVNAAIPMMTPSLIHTQLPLNHLMARVSTF